MQMKITTVLVVCLLAGNVGVSLAAEKAIPFPATLDAAAVSQQGVADVLENGMLIGNGDINGIVHVTDGKLVLRLSKNDVGDWRYDSSKDPKLWTAREIRELGAQGKWKSPGGSAGWLGKPYACPIPCGTVVVDLADRCQAGTLPARLDLRRAVARVGTTDADGACVSTVRAIADRNVFLISGEGKASLASHKVKHLGSMELRTTNGVQTMFQQLPAGVDWPGMSFSVALAERNGLKAVAIVTTEDDQSEDPVSDAIKLATAALKEGEERLVQKHEADWNRFAFSRAFS